MRTVKPETEVQFTVQGRNPVNGGTFMPYHVPNLKAARLTAEWILSEGKATHVSITKTVEYLFKD